MKPIHCLFCLTFTFLLISGLSSCTTVKEKMGGVADVAGNAAGKLKFWDRRSDNLDYVLAQGGEKSEQGNGEAQVNENMASGRTKPESNAWQNWSAGEQPKVASVEELAPSPIEINPIVAQESIRTSREDTSPAASNQVTPPNYRSQSYEAETSLSEFANQRQTSIPTPREISVQSPAGDDYEGFIELSKPKMILPGEDSIRPTSGN